MPAKQEKSMLTLFLFNLDIKFPLMFPLPGIDEPLAGVNHMFHLKVDSCVHDGQHQLVLEVKIRCVHEVQQDRQTLRIYFGV